MMEMDSRDSRNIAEEEHPFVTLHDLVVRPPSTLLIHRIKFDKCSGWDSQDIFRCVFCINDLSIGRLDKSIDEI